MDSYGFLDFKAISQAPFERVLKALEIPYRVDGGKIITDNYVISATKNLYFEKGGEKKGGSVIVFVSAYKHCSLREAAFFIKELAGDPPEERKIPELTLEHHPFLADIPEDLCKGLEVGFCKQKSIMNGRICFKVGEHYIGYHLEKKDWLFPKNFKRNTLWNIESCDKFIILIARDPFTALKLIAKGYHYTASIMGAAPTDEQKEIIKRYEFAFYD